MDTAIAKRQPFHRWVVASLATLLITVLVIAAISSPASAQTVPDAGESTPTPAVVQTSLVDEPVDDRSLLPLGIGITVIALAVYLVWGATFLVVLDKSSSRRLG